jgi:hypothetical protein
MPPGRRISAIHLGASASVRLTVTVIPNVLSAALLEAQINGARTK